jgi:hypothetical protein
VGLLWALVVVKKWIWMRWCFTAQHAVLAGEAPVECFGSSWRLTRGHVLRLFVLSWASIALNETMYGIAWCVRFLGNVDVDPERLGWAIDSMMTPLEIAVMTAAYLQLTGPPSSGGQGRVLTEKDAA